MSRQTNDVPLRTLLSSADPLNYRDFNAIIAASLKENIVTKEELANRFKITLSIVREWETNKHPGPGVRALIYRYLADKCESSNRQL